MRTSCTSEGGGDRFNPASCPSREYRTHFYWNGCRVKLSFWGFTIKDCPTVWLGPLLPWWYIPLPKTRGQIPQGNVTEYSVFPPVAPYVRWRWNNKCWKLQASRVGFDLKSHVKGELVETGMKNKMLLNSWHVDIVWRKGRRQHPVTHLSNGSKLPSWRLLSWSSRHPGTKRHVDDLTPAVCCLV